MSIERDELHRMLDSIPERKLSLVRRFLEDVQEEDDPLRRLLENVPMDDEAETEQERAGADQARKEIEAGQVLSTEELKRELGL